MKLLNVKLLYLILFYIPERFMRNPLGMLTNLVKSTRYVLRNLRNVPRFGHKNELFKHSISEVEVGGSFLEFGVYKGTSVNYIASLVPNKTVYGFDSFEGIPEHWGIMPKGYFKLDSLPEVRSNVKLIAGLFQETLESFLTEHPERIAFIHMDADLYSSTKYVLLTLARNNRLERGSVIQFDELFNYMDWWKEGEYKAFLEFAEQFKVEFEYLGYHLSTGIAVGAVSIRILKI